jgi:hypothetical protein
MISVWSRSAKLLTRYEARRIAANHRLLAELPRQKALYRTENIRAGGGGPRGNRQTA